MNKSNNTSDDKKSTDVQYYQSEVLYLSYQFFIDGAVSNQTLSRFWKLILMDVYRGLIDSIMFCLHLFNV